MIDVREDIARLAEMTNHDLRKAWRKQYRGEPPKGLSRDLLMRAVAYKLQERGHGGLSASLKRKLRLLAERDDAPEREVAVRNKELLRAGSLLIREWGGREHRVTVLDDCFDYEGHTYGSLSQIAAVITGAHWSGPRFFGLTSKRSSFERSEEGHDG